MSTDDRFRRGLAAARDAAPLAVAVVVLLGVAWAGLSLVLLPPADVATPAKATSGEPAPVPSGPAAASASPDADKPVRRWPPSSPPPAPTATPTPGRGPRVTPTEVGPPALVPASPGDPSSLAAQVEDLIASGVAGEPARFRVASFNVLGHSHTTARGNKPSYAPGPERMRGTVQLLKELQVDVVGFQEFEPVQFAAFSRLTGDSWGVYPAMSLGGGPVRNSIAFDLGVWAPVDSGTIPVPYFRGKRVPMPWLLLQHVATDRQVYFVNVHNPASSARRGDNERWRDLGTAMQVALVDRLNATAPVILTGDFNERDEAFCTVTASGLQAANGGSRQPCRPPANAGIDWIFGTPDVTFSGYERRADSERRRISDHPFIVTSASVGP